MESFATKIMPNYAKSDSEFIQEVNAAVKGTPKDMHVISENGFSSLVAKKAFMVLTKMRIPIGRFLMTEVLYVDFITEQLLKENEPKDVTKAFMKRLEAGDPKTIFGIPAIATIKNDIVWDNVFYLFSNPNFMEEDISNVIKFTLF